MNYKSITQYGVSLTIGYTINGTYTPATNYTPEQFPDIHIHEIFAYDSEVNLYDILNEDQINDIALIINSYL
jgi:hypothetical protein